LHAKAKYIPSVIPAPTFIPPPTRVILPGVPHFPYREEVTEIVKSGSSKSPKKTKVEKEPEKELTEGLTIKQLKQAIREKMKMRVLSPRIIELINKRLKVRYTDAVLNIYFSELKNIFLELDAFPTPEPSPTVAPTTEPVASAKKESKSNSDLIR
jgi:hypothetical protein